MSNEKKRKKPSPSTALTKSEFKAIYRKVRAGQPVASLRRSRGSKTGTRAEVPVPSGTPVASRSNRGKPSSIAGLTRPSGVQTIAHATYLLDLLGTLLPHRIANEELGDALEGIHQLAARGRPKWFIYLKVCTTFWWVPWHAVLYYAERIARIFKRDDDDHDK